MPVQDWSATADENTAIDGINIAEHCPAKNMNDALRAVMAALKNKCDALDSTDNTLRRGAVIGEIRWFAMSTPPDGWLVCDGSAVAISDYIELFAVIGFTFAPKEDVPPSGFRLPNLMGKVPWGSSTQIGTELKAGVPNITGRATFIQTDGQEQSNYSDLGCFFWGVYNHDWKTSAINEGPAKRDLLFDASRSNSIYGKSSTVQPPALCLLPCIRYE